MKVCSRYWCNDEVKARGLCKNCYTRWLKTGDVSKPPRRKVRADATPEERLEFYGWDVTETGCWEWRGRRDKKNYGVMSLRDVRQTFAHRVAYDVWCGVLDEKLCVLHRCDNPPCINPDHLWLATNKENLLDMTRKFRGNTTVMTEDGVRQVRAARETFSGERGELTPLAESLAAQYGVSISTIRSIWSHRTWKVIE